MIEEHNPDNHRRPGADADENLLLKTVVNLGGHSLRVAVMHDQDKDCLLFYLYSRKLNFANRVTVDMCKFKDIQSNSKIGVELTLERMISKLKGSVSEGFTYE